MIGESARKNPIQTFRIDLFSFSNEVRNANDVNRDPANYSKSLACS